MFRRTLQEKVTDPIDEATAAAKKAVIFASIAIICSMVMIVMIFVRMAH
jgi:CHASE3 domain sensor protein